MANFFASYVLSVLTLIGLVVTVVFLIQQNNINLEKAKVENFYHLHNFLNENRYLEKFNEFREYTIKRLKTPWDNGKVKNELHTINIDDIETRGSELYSMIGIATKQYNNNMINKLLFDYKYETDICYLWLLLDMNIFPEDRKTFNMTDNSLVDDEFEYKNHVSLFSEQIFLTEIKKYANTHKKTCQDIINAHENNSITLTTSSRV